MGEPTIRSGLARIDFDPPLEVQGVGAHPITLTVYRDDLFAATSDGIYRYDGYKFVKLPLYELEELPANA